jgi:hypothetical protein
MLVKSLFKIQASGKTEMKIVFFSIMAGELPWGGSEELWCRTARLALERGHQVAVVRFSWPEIPPKIRELQEQGAWLLGLIHPQEWQQFGSLRRRLKWRLERFRVWGALAAWRPEVACISQGTTADIVFSGGSTGFLDEHGVPYIVICQHNFEGHTLTNEAQRQTAIARLSRARHVAFVAEWNLRVAERQIAASLPGARVVRNPVNLANFNPVPCPNSDVIKMANIARLNVEFKGQDVLLQALSGKTWIKRQWL